MSPYRGGVSLEEEPVCDLELVSCGHYRCHLAEEIRRGNAMAEMVWTFSLTLALELVLLSAMLMKGG